MAEIATIARPYAEALFKAAGSDAAGVGVWLDELAAVASNEQLRQFGRLTVLPEIAEQFRVLKNAQLGAFDATVFSAFDIDAAALADLSGVLEKRFGRKLNLQVQLQPDLIGGVRVVVGDEVLDTSVKARLEQMKMALTA